ncbi:hypothetical protein KY290_036502 [Solanum tuberosum]|uniref:Uncharacterized protein n=1 Tax=Solanum tuberosum TaxID=4113 RepID=A0ABQ7TSV9_SOLTU|nr:hypothetical protein KY289_036006 [Solanum tuberosum]KAH0639222.1 hypothetical protein KY285_035808 [Solanum tuberosum]KAH0737797.1 hypothetical protein KY290_036502 [Solanum tuberosum]
MVVRWRNRKETKGFLWVVVGRSSNGCSDGCGSGGLEVGLLEKEGVVIEVVRGSFPVAVRRMEVVSEKRREERDD